MVRSSDVFQYYVSAKSDEERFEEVSDEESVDEFDSFRENSDAAPEPKWKTMQVEDVGINQRSSVSGGHRSDTK